MGIRGVMPGPTPKRPAMIEILSFSFAWLIAGCAVAWLLGRVSDTCVRDDRSNRAAH